MLILWISLQIWYQSSVVHFIMYLSNRFGVWPSVNFGSSLAGWRVRVVGFAFVLGEPSYQIGGMWFDLLAQRQGLYRPIWRPEGANWTYTHIRSSISASSTFSSYRSSISPASLSEPQRICMHTSLLEFLRHSWCRELHSYSFATRGDGNTFVDRACVHDLAPSEYPFFSWSCPDIHKFVWRR